MQVSKGLVAVVALVVLGLCSSLAYLLGRSAAPTAATDHVVSQPSASPTLPVVAQQPTVSPEPVALPKPAPALTVALDSISDSEMSKIEAGLGCSFVAGNKYYLFSNTSQALINPDGRLIVGSLSEEKGLALINGGGRFSVGGYNVTVTTNGKVLNRYEEGQTLGAKLVVEKDGRSKTMSGGWLCGA